MSIDKFYSLMDKLKDHPIQEAKFMGMGEPFLHPNFAAICAKFKRTFPNAKLISSTNAQYSINKNFTEALKHIDMLYISIDGAYENYERLRAPSKWSKLISFLEALKEVDRHSCNIVVNYTVSPGIVFDIPLVEKLATEYNLSEVRLNLVQNWTEEESAMTVYDTEELKFLDHYRGSIKGKAPWTWSDCFWVQDGFYCTVEGNVKVCCMNTSTQSLGNIFTNSMEEIYSGRFQSIKTGCESNCPTEHCNTCSYKELSPLLERYL
jgi:hypothetical protein